MQTANPIHEVMVWRWTPCFGLIGGTLLTTLILVLAVPERMGSVPVPAHDSYAYAPPAIPTQTYASTVNAATRSEVVETHNEPARPRRLQAPTVAARRTPMFVPPAPPDPPPQPEVHAEPPAPPPVIQAPPVIEAPPVIQAPPPQPAQDAPAPPQDEPPAQAVQPPPADQPNAPSQTPEPAPPVNQNEAVPPPQPPSQ